MDSVRALFKVNGVLLMEGMKQIKMSAIYGKEGENADFAKATPTGNFEMYVSNDVPASNFFSPGDEMYLTFTRRLKPETV